MGILDNMDVNDSVASSDGVLYQPSSSSFVRRVNTRLGTLETFRYCSAVGEPQRNLQNHDCVSVKSLLEKFHIM